MLLTSCQRTVMDPILLAFAKAQVQRVLQAIQVFEAVYPVEHW